jgi:nucleoid DNA-binding protein
MQWIPFCQHHNKRKEMVTLVAGTFKVGKGKPGQVKPQTGAAIKIAAKKVPGLLRTV